MILNDSSCPPGHNTPIPLGRSAPASFKRLLGVHLPTAQAEARTDKVLERGVVMCEQLQLCKESDAGGQRAEKKEWKLGPANGHGTPVTKRSHLADFVSPTDPATQIRKAASRTKQSACGNACAPVWLISGRPTEPGREVPLCRERNGEVDGGDHTVMVAGTEAHRSPERWRRSLLGAKVRAPSQDNCDDEDGCTAL